MERRKAASVAASNILHSTTGSNVHPAVVDPPLDEQEQEPGGHGPPPQLPRLLAGRPGLDLGLADLDRRSRLDLALVRVEQVDGEPPRLVRPGGLVPPPL